MFFSLFQLQMYFCIRSRLQDIEGRKYIHHMKTSGILKFITKVKRVKATKIVFFHHNKSVAAHNDAPTRAVKVGLICHHILVIPF